MLTERCCKLAYNQISGDIRTGHVVPNFQKGFFMVFVKNTDVLIAVQGIIVVEKKMTKIKK